MTLASSPVASPAPVSHAPLPLPPATRATEPPRAGCLRAAPQAPQLQICASGPRPPPLRRPATGSPLPSWPRRDKTLVSAVPAIIYHIRCCEDRRAAPRTAQPRNAAATPRHSSGGTAPGLWQRGTARHGGWAGHGGALRGGAGGAGRGEARASVWVYPEPDFPTGVSSVPTATLPSCPPPPCLLPTSAPATVARPGHRRPYTCAGRGGGKG